MIQNVEMKSLWIARDESGHLFAYNHKPTRAKDIWYDDNGFNSEIGSKLPDDWFPYLRWEDEPIELTCKENAIDALQEVLGGWVHGGDADCIISEFEEKLK